MNVADSLRTAAALEQLGYASTPVPEEAQVIVLNTCVVRQSAEDKAIGRLTSLKKFKQQHPEVIINLMGCLVGIAGYQQLQRRFPYVDIFSPPSDILPLLEHLTQAKKAQQHSRAVLRHLEQHPLPATHAGHLVSAYVPIVYGCSHACSYCVIPLRRGHERSRPPQEILAETQALLAQGVKEVTLLGQIVDRYGMDQPDFPSLAKLLRDLHALEGLQRIRFLTSHPIWMHDELLETVAELPKLMPHFELPVQAGDDVVLRNMRRGYTVQNFLAIVEKIRALFSQAALATDLIVGFPGESNAQFENSLDLLRAVQPDMTHVARYSPRPGTYATQNLPDNVPDEEKLRRFRLVEELQTQIATRINQTYLNQQVPVLFEEQSKERWRGRTPTNKLVFVHSERDLRGQELPVRITWTGPWSLIGELAPSTS